MINKKLSRRDFLKFLGLSSGYISFQPLPKLFSTYTQDTPHIVVLVFDAWSANHVSLYGYQRETMPNLDRFSQSATIYHRHYSAGSFTTSGTASLLTGLYPWTHRAISLGGSILPKHEQKQIFNVFDTTHSTIGYSQNVYADILLHQAGMSLHNHLRSTSFNMQHHLLYDLPFFKNDRYVAFSSIEDNIIPRGGGRSGDGGI